MVLATDEPSARTPRTLDTDCKSPAKSLGIVNAVVVVGSVASLSGNPIAEGHE